MKEMGIWVEITTLLIPALNDSDEELKDIAQFIAGSGKRNSLAYQPLSSAVQNAERFR